MCLSAYSFLVTFNYFRWAAKQSGAYTYKFIGFMICKSCCLEIVTKADSCWNIFFNFLPDIASKKCVHDWWKASCKKRHCTMQSFISFTMISLTIDQSSYIIANYTKMTLLILQSLSTLFSFLYFANRNGSVSLAKRIVFFNNLLFVTIRTGLQKIQKLISSCSMLFA